MRKSSELRLQNISMIKKLRGIPNFSLLLWYQSSKAVPFSVFLVGGFAKSGGRVEGW
jgi:hypothetical protein